MVTHVSRIGAVKVKSFLKTKFVLIFFTGTCVSLYVNETWHRVFTQNYTAKKEAIIREFITVTL
jgi:hypothetical protein